MFSLQDYQNIGIGQSHQVWDNNLLYQFYGVPGGVILTVFVSETVQGGYTIEKAVGSHFIAVPEIESN
jgi:hypothetical protein